MTNKKLIPGIYNFLRSKKGKGICILLCATIIISIFTLTSAQNPVNESTEVLSKLGSRGDEVRRIQTKLKSLGFFDGAVDGEVLNMTRAPKMRPIMLDDLEDDSNALRVGEVLHEIQYSDVDYNRHCNSCKYLEWMLNAVQLADNQRPFRLDINYVKELYQGEQMYTRFVKTAQSTQYQQVDENGTTCCSAKITQIDKLTC